ncbi:MAG TPA: TonB-dependent receptor [Chitinophaga sp.]
MITKLLSGKRITAGGSMLWLLLIITSACPRSALAQTNDPATVQGKPMPITVRGKVLSEEGDEVPGVTVRVKGVAKGTVTDADGNYTIQVPDGKATLIFSFISHTPIEVPVNDRSAVNVTLKNSVTSLNETVVVGYGTQQKTHLTGAVATVNVKEIEDLPLGNLGATLQGKLPGVSVSGGNSRPGEAGTITIRNPVVFSKDGGTTSPIFVIDDVIRTQEDFNLLDATEVESISVLKDAAAAVYGINSSQGAIVVRTKRGKAGKLVINYNSSVALNQATSLPTMMNGYEHAKYMNDIYFAGGKTQDDNEVYTPDELEHFRNNNYDWLRQAWKSSLVTRHAFNVSGGTEKATFFAGASYFYQNGNFDNIKNDKWTFRASGDVKLATGLKMGLSVSGDLSNTKLYLMKVGSENVENDMRALLFTPQFTPPYVNGYPTQLSSSSNTIDAFHFFEVQNLNNYSQTRGNGLNVVANLEYQPSFIKGLTAKVQYAKLLDNSFPKQFGTYYYVYAFNMEGGHNHIYAGDPIKTVRVKNGARVYFKPSYSDRYQLNAYLNYARKFGKHDISLLAVAEQREFSYDDVQAYTEDPTDGAPDISRFAFGNMNVWETANETGNLSYIGRANYAYDNKYLMEFAFRYDASTNFAPQYRWGFFPSLSVGWVVSQEGFFQRNVRSLDYLKFRASAGHLGGDATKPWGYVQRYTPSQTSGAVFGGNGNKSVGTKPEPLPNPAARWDDDLKFNFGIDAKALNSRLSATVDAFYDHRYNMLTSLTASVPLTVGSSISAENYNTVNAYGYEISLGWSDRIGRDINYYVNGFLSWSDAKAVQVDVDKGIRGTWEDPNGYSMDRGVRGYHYLGMFRTQEEVDAYLSKNPDYKVFGKKPEPGMMYYQDIRGAKDPLTNQYAGPDGVVDENDEDWLNNKANNHYGFGLSVGGGYKGFRIDMVMSGAFGGQNVVEGDARKQATVTSNRPAFWSDHWTPENPNAKYPSPYYTDQYNVSSSFWFRNSFSFRMRTINLSYTFSQSLAKSMGFQSFKVYMAATNPFNFYNPYDYKDNALGSYAVYPLMRTIAFGLNVSL